MFNYWDEEWSGMETALCPYDSKPEAPATVESALVVGTGKRRCT